MEKTNNSTSLIQVSKLQDFTYAVEKGEKCYELTILLNKDNCLNLKVKDMTFPIIYEALFTLDELKSKSYLFKLIIYFSITIIMHFFM